MDTLLLAFILRHVCWGFSLGSPFPAWISLLLLAAKTLMHKQVGLSSAGDHAQGQCS